ncbi:MAG: hypothetical protein ABI856_14570, partial [Nitrospira sp.]
GTPMGETRIQEVTMFALLFLLIGVVVLLAAAGRIWIDPPPSDSRIVDSTTANSPGKSVTLRHMPGGEDSVV